MVFAESTGHAVGQGAEIGPAVIHGPGSADDTDTNTLAVETETEVVTETVTVTAATETVTVATETVTAVTEMARGGTGIIGSRIGTRKKRT